MVGRSTHKRQTPTKEQEPSTAITTTPVASTSTTGFTGDPCVTSTPRISSEININPDELDQMIERYLFNSQYKNAMFWADKRLALCHSNGTHSSYVDKAHFIKVVAAVGDWTRLISYTERHELTMKHLFFAYYFVVALFRKKQYMDILRIKFDSLSGFSDPVSSNESVAVSVTRSKSKMPSDDEKNKLDQICNDLKLEAGLLLLIGKTYLITQNRRAAQLCLMSAADKDSTGVEAFDLIRKYKLIPDNQFEDILARLGKNGDVLKLLQCFYAIQSGKVIPAGLEEGTAALDTDLAARTSRALQLYQYGHAEAAYKITSEILDETGMFEDCLLVHLASMVQLRKERDLFTLAHQLVESQPDNEVSWYAVGCYYYSVGHMVAAKSFFNKCTSMNSSFGEGWLAFGHVLTAESEHEQAMNCYLRASRVLEGSFEPLMYIGLQYTYANNTKLAQDFLRDALDIAEKNPLVLHEQGCIHYMKKDYKSADICFTTALKLAYGLPIDYFDISSILHRPLSEFWEPLVTNLGHVKRKLLNFREAVKYHQKSLLMCPRKASSICAIGLNLASAGRIQKAMEFFHEALSVSAHDAVPKQALDKVMEFISTTEYAHQMRFEPTFTISPQSFELTMEEYERQKKAVDVLRRRKTRQR